VSSLKSVNRINHGDCIAGMNDLPAGSVDLAFADPPFNIGYEYDQYDDKKEHQDYLSWSRDWIAAVHRVLKETGTFWLAIGDEYAAELKLLSQEVGFHTRSWVIWYYTFGVNCKSKFTRSHAHLFYFVKDPKRFTFLADVLENRVPSARQLVYADSRGNPNGRLPDDTWVLRPQDLADSFTPAEDTWYFPRVAGTFKERAGFHGCQMPEQLLGRIIRFCSNEGELVLDPFSGSATTLAVAKKLGRKYLGFDLSEEYAKRGTARLELIRRGDALDGAAEPTVSAPSTPKLKGAKGKRSIESISQPAADGATLQQRKLFHDALLNVYRSCYGGYSLDRMIADPQLNAHLIDGCTERGLPGDAITWNLTLFRLRKSGAFADLPTTRRTEYSWDDCDEYLFASEIAWREMIDDGCDSLDYILCDPHLSQKFDKRAESWAPGFSPLEYRWAALKLRKNAKLVRNRAQLLTSARLSRKLSIDKLPNDPGVYVLASEKDELIYAGEASNLHDRVARRFGSAASERIRIDGELLARFFVTSCSFTTRLAHQRRLVGSKCPRLNLPDTILA